MLAVAVRHLDAWRHPDIEARLIVDQNNMRRPGFRLTRIVADRLQMIVSVSVGLEEAMRHQLGNRIHRRPGKHRNLVVAVVSLERLHRYVRFERDETDGTAKRR